MIHIKTEKELEKMRVAGRLTAIARKAAADAVKPGVTTWEIDRIVRKTIEDASGISDRRAPIPPASATAASRAALAYR